MSIDLTKDYEDKYMYDNPTNNYGLYDYIVPFITAIFIAVVLISVFDNSYIIKDCESKAIEGYITDVQRCINDGIAQKEHDLFIMYLILRSLVDDDDNY